MVIKNERLNYNAKRKPLNISVKYIKLPIVDKLPNNVILYK